MKVLLVYEQLESLIFVLSGITKTLDKTARLDIKDIQSIHLHQIKLTDRDHMEKATAKFSEFDCKEDVLIACSESLYEYLYSEDSLLIDDRWIASDNFKMFFAVWKNERWKDRIVI